MIYAYIRVSTDKQDNDNQRLELTKWAERDGWTIDKWIEETVSGTKDWTQRKLKSILKKAKRGDRIVCSELSRLARKYLMLMEILSICQKHGVEVWTRKGDYRLGDNIQSQVMAFAFGISAQVERDMISARTKDGLARVKAQGKILGKPLGSFSRKLLDNRSEVDALLAAGERKCDICNRFGFGRSTLYNYLKRTAIK